MQRFICPICEDTVNVSTEAGLSLHLDECLSNQTIKPEPESSRLPDHTTSNMTITSNEKSGVSCPICGNNISESIMNGHIDECLNSETIQILRNEQQTEDQSKKRKIETCKTSRSEKKRQKVQEEKNKSILNYFKPKD